MRSDASSSRSTHQERLGQNRLVMLVPVNDFRVGCCVSFVERYQMHTPLVYKHR